jgi:hypothetical protein
LSNKYSLNMCFALAGHRSIAVSALLAGAVKVDLNTTSTGTVLGLHCITYLVEPRSLST